MKAIIIDDETRSVSILSKLLGKLNENIEIIGTASNVKDGALLINNENPDCIFLDIKMPGESGFELFKHVKEINFSTIFTTAHDEYAISAIRCGALDYILKPIDFEELGNAVNRAKKKLSSSLKLEEVKEYLTNISSNQSRPKRIPIANLSGLEFVETDKIVRCSADNNYTKIHMNDGQIILTSKTLKDYDNILSKFGFFRCHRSHMINLDYIKEYIKGRNSKIVLADNFEVALSNNRKTEFLAAIHAH